MGDPDALNAAGFVVASNAVLAAVVFQVGFVQSCHG